MTDNKPYEFRCMECGAENETVELGLVTNDFDHNVYGIEHWSYCTKCEIDTFHPVDQGEADLFLGKEPTK